MSTIAEQWADYALSLRLSEIPRPVIQNTKRLFVDTLACALGGYDNETQRVILDAGTELTGPEESTVIGDGRRATALNAILINGAMVRYLDANDISLGGHNSEVIPAALAVGEREGASGADILVSTIVGYELAARLHLAIQAASMSAADKELELRGWNGDLRAGFIMPAVFGRLLRLDRTQIANAIGISGSRSALLGIIDAPKEQNTLAKNIRFPFTAYMALISTYLAGKGLTGPIRVFEGQMGFNETVMHGAMDLERLTSFGDEWFTMRASIKGFSACYATHGHLQATVDLVRDINLEPDQVEAIKIVTNSRTMWHTGDAETRRRVHNKETADHSSYYVTAIAILYGAVGPQHYNDQLYADVRVLNLMDRISIEADDSAYKDVYPGSRVEILTQDGRTHVREAKHPRGHYLNPMTDEEVSQKFRSMAERYMSPTQQDKVISAVNELEGASSPARLMKSLVFRAGA